MAESSSEALPVPPPASRSRKKGGGAKFLFVMMIILALLGVIVYLMSLMNSKKFFLVPEGDKLVIKKGVFFLAGSELYTSQDPEEATLFTPIELPQRFGREQREFDSKEAMEKEFGSILLVESETLVKAADDVGYQKGKAYLQRLARLNLTPVQQDALKLLNADVSYIEAKRAYQGVEKTLERARHHFILAAESKSANSADAREWLAKVEHLLTVIRQGKAAKTPEALGPGSKPGSLPPGSLDQDDPAGLEEPPAGPGDVDLAPPVGDRQAVPKGGI